LAPPGAEPLEEVYVKKCKIKKRKEYLCLQIENGFEWINI
jgi:hypothetical protein